MRKYLLWSLFAATAILTACNDDNVVSTDNITPKGEKVGVDFTVGIGKSMGTYATESESGAWTNFKNDESMKKDYTRRAVLQVYQEGATDYMDEQRVLVAEDAEGNEINFANLRLAPGATYTAVVWVDFIANGATTGAATEDLYYTTSQLNDISMKDAAGDVAQTLNPEGRDAYTAAVTFTLAADGKYQVNGGEKDQAIVTAIPLTAKRPFGKVRIVMTDKANKAEWEKYFTAASNSRLLNYVALDIAGLNTSYNALTQDVKSATIGNFQFHHAYNSTITGTTFWSQNNIKWVDENGKSAEQANAKYPVLDYNYFLPAGKTKAASYSLDIKMFKMPAEEGDFAAALEAALAATGTTGKDAVDEESGEPLTWACISYRSLAGIPVKTNCLTTIKGNFLTYGYNYQVTVSDLFDGSVEETITVDDNGGKTGQVETKTVGNATVAITKDPADGTTVQSIAVTGMDADSQEKVKELIEGTTNHQNVAVTLGKVATDITALDWSSFALNNVSVSMDAALDANCSMNFSAGAVAISSTVKQTKAISVTNVNKDGTITLNGTEYAEVTTAAKAVTVESGAYDKLTANSDETGNSLAVNDGATITALSSNCATITLTGTTTTHNESEAAEGTSLALTNSTAKTQTLVIEGNPVCIPATITVAAVQYIDLQADNSGVWSTESGSTDKWSVVEKD